MSKNQIAFKEKRITERDYDRMAVYKWNAYENNEDLDYNKDYREHDLYKLMPIIHYTPVAETFLDAVTDIYSVFKIHLNEEDLAEVCRQWLDPGHHVLITNYGSWYWVPWAPANGDFAFLESRLNDDLHYSGKLEVFDAVDDDYFLSFT